MAATESTPGISATSRSTRSQYSRRSWPVGYRACTGVPDTAYAIEGNVKVQVPEWADQWVQIKLEQSAVFDGERVLYLAGRQTTWHLIH